MRRVLGLDFEATGLLEENPRILEVGAVLYDVDEKIPLAMVSEMVDPGEIEPGYISPTGLRGSDVIEFGESFCLVMNQVEQMINRHKPDALVGHNIVNYDIPLLKKELERVAPFSCPALLALPIIDTRQDLPFAKEPGSRKLVHLIAEAGFLNPYPHRAVFDVMACLKLMSGFDFTEVLAHSKVPFITMRACVSYDDRQKAKDARFSWEEAGGVKYPKWWVKQVREDAVEREINQAKEKGFIVSRV